MKQTVQTIQAKKQRGEKITMLTCYDYTTAKLMDAAGLDMLLVGDSLGNVILGYEDTVSSPWRTCRTMPKQWHVVQENAMVAVDMPLSYQTSVYDAAVNAGRLMKRAVPVRSLEGGAVVCDQIRAIVQASIPVVAHLGMTPQSVNTMGGFKVQGKTADAAKKLLADAKAVEEAGAFALVLECVPAKLAAWISGKLTIPTIGIGAGAGCDGQVLVYQDMLGMFSDYQPKFVRHFADVGSVMRDAFAQYREAVHDGSFPAKEHEFAISDEIMAQLEQEEK
ncbi:MAG: 3-methyl-2-oxobutanoate hydroxymethyltransferase [Ruminococcus sp.]